MEKWTKFPVLDDGFVAYVDHMGTDSDIIQAARVSYNGDDRDDRSRLEAILKKQFGIKSWYNEDEKKQAAVTLKQEERTLLRYLMRHRHSTPLEMAEVKLLIRIPMDAWRQMIRHRTANVNEYSTRYTEAIDSKQKTPSGAWRSQSKNNKQGSGDFLSGKFDDSTSLTIGEYLSEQESFFHQQAEDLYKQRLNFGVAKEQARKDLPLSTYTEAYWKCDLHNILHFLGLRMDSHAQLEIRSYANVIGGIIKELFPLTWEAFIDYKFESLTLSRLDILVAKELQSLPMDLRSKTLEATCDGIGMTNKREQEECRVKLTSLGII